MPRSTNERMIITDLHPLSPISESYRTLRTNIRFSAVDQQIKILQITSTQPNEGKTTTVINLATAYAQEGKKVLVIDGDLRKPSIHKAFFKSNRDGLTNILINPAALSEVINPTHIENLSIITSGPIPPNPSEILASKRMASLLTELRELYDIILIDSPPVLAITDAQIIASLSDGVILVMNSGKVKRDYARKAKESLELVKARILGVVLNNTSRNEYDSFPNYYYGNRKR